MYRSSDIIRFRFADPYLAGEKWADKPNCEKVVEIIINEREILEYFREIEATYRKEEGLDEEDGYSDYGHVSAKELYEDLHWIERENDYNKDDRAYLCCCGVCGMTGCWSVSIKTRTDKEHVYWYDFLA